MGAMAAVLLAALFSWFGGSLAFAVWMGVRVRRRMAAPAVGVGDRPVGWDEPAPACPNCGVRRQGRFCAACGQNDRDYLRSPFAVVRDILAETFEADSRLWRTMRALFLRPGLLSLEFSRSRRARYLSPLRLYVFASLLYFFAEQLAYPYLDLSMPAGEGEAAPARIDPVPAAVEAMKGRLDANRVRKVDEVMAGPLAPVLAEYAKVGGHVDGFGVFVAERLVDLLHDPTSVAFSASNEYAPVAVLFALPLFALVLHLLLIRRGRHYAEHLVFGTHTFALVFIALGVWYGVVAATSAAWHPWHRIWMDGVVATALMGYFFIAFKRFYGTGVPATFAATLFLAGTWSALLLGIVIATLWLTGGLEAMLFAG